MSNSTPPLTVDALRQYVQIELLNDEELNIEDDQDLLLSGMLDSLNVIRLATYIEQTCGFDIPPEDVTIENFSTLKLMEEYISTRL